MDPDAFEAFCALLWSKMGYRNTFKTPRVGDGGVDVVALRDKEGIVIQCKVSSVVGKELGWEAVKDIAAGAPAYAQRFPGVRLSMAAATNQYFNETARRQAKVLHVELFDGNGLAEMLRETPVCQRELFRFLLGSQGPN